MEGTTACSMTANLLLFLLLQYVHGNPEKTQSRNEDTKDNNKDHIPIAEEWLDNSRRQVPSWLKEPPIPSTKHLTLCKTSPPAVAGLDSKPAPLPTRDSCQLLLRSLESRWLYFDQWTLPEAEPSTRTPQQPWILAQYGECLFVVTGWQPPEDNGGKKLEIEVGNDDVKNLVRESLDHHQVHGTAPIVVGARGNMICGGTHVEWQLRKMECPEGRYHTMSTWCKY
ncbi:hypothetical protein PG999_005123 [Apiospora kogelbergensis]|uniref:Ecp2 effector protein-like domain-containing protein n=1 Tax=Apiospora kogelbergensis TaxID=1337665 RepID=A0AAW0R1A0_9PEZI